MTKIYRTGLRAKPVARISSRKRYGLLLVALVLAATAAGFTATGRDLSSAVAGANFKLKLPNVGGLETALY